MPDLFSGTVSPGPGWQAFADGASYLRYAVVMLAATLSGAVLAFHPAGRGRPESMEDVELRKTLIIYSVVGSLISIICTVAPSMAFVIFGIGGLLRFRTDLASSKSTGHAIMGTIVGLCWGLGLELVAVMATVYKKAIERAGARVRGSSKNFKKEQMSFVFRLPRGTKIEDIQNAVAQISEELRGTPDWQD
ncbi:MAG: hypothetical protein MUC50_07935 [Myxococcota bacterium]|nr:hypothetical protein [Myxococcota bacterium]